MHSRLISTDDDRRTFCLVLDTGDEAIETLTTFAGENNLTGSHFTAIGAFQYATLAYFDWESRDYEELPVNEQVEVASLAGNVARTEDGEVRIHAHAVLGRRDGSALAGHLMRGTVRPTLEIIITEQPAHLTRRTDPETGLALLGS